MKRINILLLGMLFLAMSIFSTNAQNLEAEKTHALSKDAKKGYLGSFEYDENSKVYTMVFVREKNKKTIYVTYKFDYDFNQISENEEELTLIQASKKYDWVDYDEGGGWNDPIVVRVDASAWGAGQVVLRKGKITREWATSSWETHGVNYTVYNWVGYWKYNFEEMEKVKPKIEIPVDMPAGTPNFVVKMVENAAKKIYLVAYQTDEPGVEVTTGARSFNPRYSKTVWEKTRDYSAASGDIVIVGKQGYATNEKYFNRYVAQKYSAEDLSLKNQTLIDIDFGVDAIFSKVLPDQSIAFIVAPLPQVYVKPDKPNPNTRAFTFIRVDKDANLQSKIDFESPSSKWNISDIVLTPDNDLYIFGEASQDKNDKYYAQQLNVSKFDNFQLMKIRDGKMVYITSTPIDEFKAKLQFPPNIKKADPYTGKKFEVGLLTVSSKGDVFISGQNLEGGKYGDITLFHFDTNGKLKTQYAYRLEETNPTAVAQSTLHVEMENPDGKTFTWIVYEIRGQEDGKFLLYPRVATIDLESATVSDFITLGFSSKEKYYCDNSHPIILIDNDKKAVFFGTDLKEKTLWFSRVGLGK